MFAGLCQTLSNSLGISKNKTFTSPSTLLSEAGWISLNIHKNCAMYAILSVKPNWEELKRFVTQKIIEKEFLHYSFKNFAKKLEVS